MSKIPHINVDEMAKENARLKAVNAELRRGKERLKAKLDTATDNLTQAAIMQSKAQNKEAK